MCELFVRLQTSEELKFTAESWNPTGRDPLPPLPAFRPTWTLTRIKEFQTPHSPWIFLLSVTGSMQIPVLVFTQSSRLRIPGLYLFAENEVKKPRLSFPY